MTADTQDEADTEERKRSRLGNRRLRELLVDDADDRGSGRAKIERYIPLSHGYLWWFRSG